MEDFFKERGKNLELRDSKIGEDQGTEREREQSENGGLRATSPVEVNDGDE